jgi:hypothetical protein
VQDCACRPLGSRRPTRSALLRNQATAPRAVALELQGAGPADPGATLKSYLVNQPLGLDGINKHVVRSVGTQHK